MVQADDGFRQEFEADLPEGQSIHDLHLLAIPTATYDALRERAVAQGITVADAMRQALRQYLGRTDEAKPQRQLLVESVRPS
jgi:hypothetical protein